MMSLLANAQTRLIDATCYNLRVLRRKIGKPSPIVFCLNTGRCGSTSIVRFLQHAGLRNCYHELCPDLLQEGVDYFHGKVDALTVSAKLRSTRAGVFFEANNRLFSLTYPIKMAFPNARFVFLYRDGRDVVRSGLQRGWYGPHDRFRHDRLGAEVAGETMFVKTCRYWALVNERILNDLVEHECDFVCIRFEDLVSGTAVGTLGEFLGVAWSRPTPLPSVNGTRDWSVPAYGRWSHECQHQFEAICGPMMRQLGYTTCGSSTSQPCYGVLP